MRYIGAIIMTLAFSGCSMYSSRIECPEPKSLGCGISIPEIDQLSKDGQLEEYREKGTVCHDCKKAQEKKVELLRGEKLKIDFNAYEESGIWHKQSSVEVSME